MKCSYVRFGGVNAIVCGSTRINACVKCGRPSSRLCDWKVGKDRTCDKPLCDECTYKPVAGKDLCPTHRKRWNFHPANKAAQT